MISNLTKPSLNTQLTQAEERHKLLSKQFADIEKSLATLEIGTPAYAESAQLATRLKGYIPKGKLMLFLREGGHRPKGQFKDTFG